MKTEDDDIEYRTGSREADERNRYGEVSLETGEIVIYDRKNQNAWIQSRVAVKLESKA